MSTAHALSRPELATTRSGSVLAMAAALKRLARQVEAPDRRVLVEIAQDVGELQRAPEVMGERNARRGVHPEHAHAQPADRARDAVAVEVERGEIGCPDIGEDVHLHAVDDGEKVLAAQPEGADRVGEPGEPRRLAAREGGIHVGAPLLELLEARLARAPVVGDVVDRAAEAVDLEDGVAALARQDAHRRIERAAGRAPGGNIGSGFADRHAGAHASCGLCRPTPKHASGASPELFHDSQETQRGKPGSLVVHALAQRIAPHERLRQLLCHPMNHRNLQAKAHVADEGGERVGPAQQNRGALDDVAQAAS